IFPSGRQNILRNHMDRRASHLFLTHLKMGAIIEYPMMAAKDQSGKENLVARIIEDEFAAASFCHTEALHQPVLGFVLDQIARVVANEWRNPVVIGRSDQTP